MNRYVYEIAYGTIKNKFIYTERKTLKRAIKFIRNFINNNNTKDSYTHIELYVLNKKSRRPIYIQGSWGELIAFGDSAIEAALKNVLRRYCE